MYVSIYFYFYYFTRKGHLRQYFYKQALLGLKYKCEYATLSVTKLSFSLYLNKRFLFRYVIYAKVWRRFQLFTILQGRRYSLIFVKKEQQEKQRYGRDKSTVIDNTYINSGEYRNKFDKISDNKDLNRLVYNLAKKMLYHRSGTQYEDMYLIDIDTLEIVATETNQKKEGSIKYSKKQKKQ